MSEFETSHRLHFLFYYKTKCKFQLEIEKVAKNKSSLLKIGCFEVKRLTLLATFTLKQPILGREFLFLATFFEVKMMRSFKFTHFAILNWIEI